MKLEVSAGQPCGGGSWWALGSFLGVCLSVKTWGCTWWAVLHAATGWFYVAYWTVFRSGWL